MTILATRSLVDQAECGFHLIACTSNTLKRVCRSTLTAETYQTELGVEAVDQLRATLADTFEPLPRKQWEIEATSAIQLVWVTVIAVAARWSVRRWESRRISVWASRLRLSGRQFGDAEEKLSVRRW